MAAQYDLTVVPINPTDYLVVENSEHRHTFKVITVEGKEGERRSLTVERITSTDPTMNRRGTLVMHPGQPVMGLRLTEVEFQAGMGDFEEDAGTINNMALTELQSFLEGLEHKGRKAPFKVCIDYLSRKGLLPKNATYEVKRNRLSKLIHGNPETFLSKGTYIELLTTRKPNARQYIPTQSALDAPVEISLYHLNKGIYHILMSGLLTGGRPVKLVDIDRE